MNPFLADSVIVPVATGTPAYSDDDLSQSFAPSSGQPEDSSFAPELADVPNPEPAAVPGWLLAAAGIAALMFVGGSKR
jgi:hypothetical protein